MKGLVVAILVAWLGTSATGIGAQEQIDLNKPTIEIVRAVGCASASSAPGDWTLTNATEPTVVRSPFTSTTEIEELATEPLANKTFKLLGTAEFVSVERLLRQSRRAEFTAGEPANATGTLRDGYKVVVRGLLLDPDGNARINLTSVQILAQSCP